MATIITLLWRGKGRISSIAAKARETKLEITCVVLLIAFPVDSFSAPDAAIRLSKSTIESLLPSILPDNIELTEPLGSSMDISSVSLELNANPALIRILGSITEDGKDHSIPISANISLDFDVENGALVLTPIVLDIEPRYSEIAIYHPITLLKAWLLSTITISPSSISSISIPLQSQFELSDTEKTIRSNQRFGGATADVVAHVTSNGIKANLRAETVKVIDGTIWIYFSETGAGNKNSVDITNLTLNAEENGLFLSGELLSRFLTRTASSVSVPFYIENPKGKIDGRSSSTVFGRKEWYVEFQGKRPLVGKLQMRNSFHWNQQLQFSSHITISARARVHGHGDPGPGGGCGVRPQVKLDGESNLGGLLSVSVQDGNIVFSLDANNPPPARLNYDVERVNFCGFATQGPFRGAFEIEIPSNLVRTRMEIQPLGRKISNDYSIDTTIRGIKATIEGYWISFDVKID